MKSFRDKNAMTLVELIISSAISAIILFIVFTFIVDTMWQITDQNIRTEWINEWFSFKNKFDRFFRWWYNEPILINTWAHNSTILLKDNYNNRWVVFWVVDDDTNKIREDYIYWNNIIGYRLLSQTELAEVELDNETIYDKTFFDDKLFHKMRIKDFIVDIYNQWEILDIMINVINTRNDKDFWKSLSWTLIKPELITTQNLIF